MLDRSTHLSTRRIACGLSLAIATLVAGCGGGNDPVAFFSGGNLIVSRTVYAGTASTVTVGQALPGGGTATANGSFPDVFKNEVPDPSVGVSSPVFLDQSTRAT